MKQKGICMKRIIYITIACAFLSVSFAKAQQIRTLKDCLEEEPDKGRISASQAKVKAESEYDIFNKTQRIDSDFDKQVRGMLDK